jgi:hypothetical protein
VPRETPFVGFDVRGRNGTLGVVAAPDAAAETESGSPMLLVVGGRSSLLHLYIPLSRVSRVSTDERRVDVDLDVADFTPRIGHDGKVELHLTG